MPRVKCELLIACRRVTMRDKVDGIISPDRDLEVLSFQ